MSGLALVAAVMVWAAGVVAVRRSGENGSAAEPVPVPVSIESEDE